MNAADEGRIRRDPSSQASGPGSTAWDSSVVIQPALVSLFLRTRKATYGPFPPSPFVRSLWLGSEIYLENRSMTRDSRVVREFSQTREEKLLRTSLREVLARSQVISIFRDFTASSNCAKLYRRVTPRGDHRDVRWNDYIARGNGKFRVTLIDLSHFRNYSGRRD